MLLTATPDKTLSLWASGQGPDQASQPWASVAPLGQDRTITHSLPGLAGEGVRQLESDDA